MSAKSTSLARKWWLWAGVAIVAAVLIAVWQTRPLLPPPPVVNTTGFDPMIAQAIAEARTKAESFSRSAQSRGELGMVLLAHDIRAQARLCFEQASRLASREPRWPYLLGLAMLIDNPMGAVTNLEKAVKLLPETDLIPRLKLADTLLGLGRLDEAEAEFRLVQKMDPSSAPAKLGLGKIANSRGRSAEAVAILAGATADPSTRKAAHRLLINLNQRLGNTNEIATLESALAKLPNDTPLQDRFLAEVQRLKTGEAAWVEQADEWMKAGRVAEAMPLLEKTLQHYPKSDRAMFLLGRARLRVGDAAGAEALLMKAVELAPGSVEAQMQLGVTRLRRGRAADAQPCFRAAIQAKPNLGEAWFNLALSLGQDPGKRGESMGAFREAIRLKPNMVEAYLGLAVVLRAEGQRAAAAEELHRALSLNPEEGVRRNILEQLKLVERP